MLGQTILWDVVKRRRPPFRFVWKRKRISEYYVLMELLCDGCIAAAKTGCSACGTVHSPINRFERTWRVRGRLHRL